MNKHLETAGQVERMLAEASILVAQSTVDLVKRCRTAEAERDAALARLAELEHELTRVRAKWQEDYLLLDEVCRKAQEQEKRLAEIERQEPDEIDWPDYHQQAMGCGLEDRGIRDRYEAMQYGWDQAIEHVAERLPENLYAAAGASPVEPSESVEHRDELAKRKPEPAAETVGGLAKAVKAARGGDAPPAPMRGFA